MTSAVQANLFAYLMLFSWPLVAIGFFLTCPPRWACALTLIGGDMFLPPQFFIPLSGLPALDKDIVASLAALLGCMIVRPRAIFGRGHKKKGPKYFGFVLVMIVGAFFTIQSNADALRAGHRLIPGLTIHDFSSMAMHDLVYWWPAFFLGRKLFSKAEDIGVILTVLTIGGLVYSLFILVELRLSPQLNRWIYGYSQADFVQTVRAGGYRPTVFMRHGLNVALFMLTCVLAATGLARSRIRVLGLPAGAIAVYLALVLAGCHSAGALVYGVVLVPALIWSSVRWQARLAIAIAGLVLLYPLLRFYDLIPVDSILNFFKATFGADRAGSLEFRLRNEHALLAKAVERPWFGWGFWGRQFTYNEWGATSLADGEWILVLGYSGVVGFLGVFGLLLFPIFSFARTKLRHIGSRKGRIIGCTALFIGSAYVFDLLPNAGVAPYLMMIIGALAGIEVEDVPPDVPQDSAVYLLEAS